MHSCVRSWHPYFAGAYANMCKSGLILYLRIQLQHKLLHTVRQNQPRLKASWTLLLDHASITSQWSIISKAGWICCHKYDINNCQWMQVDWNWYKGDGLSCASALASNMISATFCTALRGDFCTQTPNACASQWGRSVLFVYAWPTVNPKPYEHAWLLVIFVTDLILWSAHQVTLALQDPRISVMVKCESSCVWIPFVSTCNVSHPVSVVYLSFICQCVSLLLSWYLLRTQISVLYTHRTSIFQSTAVERAGFL